MTASAFCPHFSRNLADCVCSGASLCSNCRTPAGKHHHKCFRCPVLDQVLNAIEESKFRASDDAAHRLDLQHGGGAS